VKNAQAQLGDGRVGRGRYWFGCLLKSLFASSRIGWVGRVDGWRRVACLLNQ
jgi:hypothetical protein